MGAVIEATAVHPLAFLAVSMILLLLAGLVTNAALTGIRTWATIQRERIELVKLQQHQYQQELRRGSGNDQRTVSSNKGTRITH